MLDIKISKKISLSLKLGACLIASDASIDLIELRDLLRVMAVNTSIRAVVKAIESQSIAKLNYRSVWGRLEQYQLVFGRSLAIKRQGQGTALSPFGKALLETLNDALIEPPGLSQVAASLSYRIDQLISGRANAALRLCASHDPELLKIAQTMTHHLAVQTAGSQMAVNALLVGQADIAGFHSVGDQALALQRLGFGAKQLQQYWVVPVALRAQGLIVQKGNPKNIKGLKDLSRRSVVFINRQVQSGTRQLFDQLLTEAQIDPSSINGYADEEFTHRAVAALIASGKADAGLGLAAAAYEFGLDFIALAQEVYYLAGRLETAPLDPVVTLIDRFRRVAGSTRGYQSTR